MGALVLLFLDLATLPSPPGNDASLYRQVMADHHLQGAWFSGGHRECAGIFADASDVPPALALAFTEKNRITGEPTPPGIQFSAIGRAGNLSAVQTTVEVGGGAEVRWCSIYRRHGARFQLVREVRLTE